MDKSWGSSPFPDFRIRTNASPDQRAQERAAARAARTAERDTLASQRLEDRAKRRDADMAAREQERERRREAEIAAASTDVHAEAAKRHRSSGRKDVVREQRDTRGYATIVDIGRMRELAKRGASVGGLAAAFGVTVEEVEAALAADDQE